MIKSTDNVFQGLVDQFLKENDFSQNTCRAFRQDLKKFASWFEESNNEAISVARITTRDVSDFRNHLRNESRLAVATVNRALVALRRFLHWLVDQGHIAINPAGKVKELRQQTLAPKGLEQSQVRKLLREVELRGDTRANAIFHCFLYTGCRVGDLVNLQLTDLVMNQRSGSVIYRNGKGNKERTVPLPLQARKVIQDYLLVRPMVGSFVFLGDPYADA